MRTTMLLLGLAGLLAGCGNPPESDEPENEAAESESAEPGETVDLAEPDAGWTRDWLVGTWSYAMSCATDNTVKFEEDGTLYGSEVRGTYEIDGAMVTEIVTEEVEMGDPGGPTPIDPPNEVTYQVRMIDQDHAEFTYDNGESLEVLRCS